MPVGSVQTEEHRVTGERLLTKIRELVHQGNIRRIIIKNERDQVLIEVPLTIGVVGTILVPVWVAIGAMAALLANFNITVEKLEQEPTTPRANLPRGEAVPLVSDEFGRESHP